MSQQNAGQPSTDGHKAQSHFTSLESIVMEITSSNSPDTLAERLRAFSSNRDRERELILASHLPGGQDPLELLNVRKDTVGWAFLLSARLAALTSGVIVGARPAPHVLLTFCEGFDPTQACYVLDRLTLLARTFVDFYEASNQLADCIPLLLAILNRSIPSLSTLTPIHAIFARVCLRSRQYTTALPVLQVPITTLGPTQLPSSSGSGSSSSSAPLSQSNSQSSSRDVNTKNELMLQYQDFLTYHYAGGLAFAALHRWSEAEEFLELAVTAPVHTLPSAVQFEALKKLALVQLILYGKTKDLPKYTSGILLRLFRTSPYAALVSSFPAQRREFRALVEKERSTFEQDRNLSLLNIVLSHAPRWCLQRLKATYCTLSLREIAENVGLASEDVQGHGNPEDRARALVLSMIENAEIAAELDGDGYVTFADIDPSQLVSKEKAETLLRDAKAHAARLTELDQEIARSREFLSKALKSKDDSLWASGSAEDEMMFGGGDLKGSGRMDWVEESLFE